tara:strand:+ start:34 stop:198 length:165 start_codon:yes stop_codon:yes gene_type:complete
MSDSFKTKQVNIEYFVEKDSEGERRIKVVTTTTKWFDTNESKHNPTISTTYEYL